MTHPSAARLFSLLPSDQRAPSLVSYAAGKGQGIVYLQGGLVPGESTFIRERAREKGLTQKELARHVAVSEGYILSDVCRGRRDMRPAVQLWVERVLGNPVQIVPAVCVNRPAGVVRVNGVVVQRKCPV